jgi:HPt (histidine-containing phosphotransfer) domain-containing protein
MEPGSPDLSAALERLWARFLPEIRERVSVLENASATLATGALTPQERDSAHAMAHKLAGVLGTFNLARGTELAREAELIYGREDGPDPASAPRLGAISAELRSLVESRSQSE